MDTWCKASRVGSRQTAELALLTGGGPDDRAAWAWPLPEVGGDVEEDSGR
jgi:hypothetical protein